MRFPPATIFVEGPTDKKIIQAVLEIQKCPATRVVTYAQRPRGEITRFVNAEIAKQARIIWLQDEDTASGTQSREKALGTGLAAMSAPYLHIVRKEIESWYLAGWQELDASIADTSQMGKKHFDEFSTRRQLQTSKVLYGMILDNFDCGRACQRNESFQKFVQILKGT